MFHSSHERGPALAARAGLANYQFKILQPLYFDPIVSIWIIVTWSILDPNMGHTALEASTYREHNGTFSLSAVLDQLDHINQHKPLRQRKKDGMLEDVQYTPRTVRTW